MNCTYVPSSTERWLLPPYATISSEVTERDGGYFYRARQNIRTFSLNCFFEDITERQLRRIAKWQDHKTAGDLIFDDRPDVVYKVRPSKQFTPEIYEHHLEDRSEPTFSGTFTATFSAYDPFGYQTKQSYSNADNPEDYIHYCGMIHDDYIPMPPIGTSREMLVYNCGTEPCGAYISVRGKAPNGFTITNRTNGTSCKILGMPPSPLLLVIDSDNCRVMCGNGTFLSKGYIITDDGFVLVDDNSFVLYSKPGMEGTELDMSSVVDAFDLHDEGYIRLEPYDEVYRDILVTWTANTNIARIQSDNIDVSDALIGKHIFLNNEWTKIVDVLDDGGQVLTDTFLTSDSQITMITTMNELEISGDDIGLESLTITCNPKVL